MKKALLIALAVWAVWYLATQPDQAAQLVHHVFGWVQHAAASLARFVNGIGG